MVCCCIETLSFNSTMITKSRNKIKELEMSKERKAMKHTISHSPSSREGHPAVRFHSIPFRSSLDQSETRKQRISECYCWLHSFCMPLNLIMSISYDNHSSWSFCRFYSFFNRNCCLLFSFLFLSRVRFLCKTMIMVDGTIWNCVALSHRVDAKAMRALGQRWPSLGICLICSVGVFVWVIHTRLYGRF